MSVQEEIYEITDDDYPEVTHTPESFHADAGDIILADTVEENEKLRVALANAVYWVNSCLENKSAGDDWWLERCEHMQASVLKVGMLIARQTIANGYDDKKLGVRK